MQQDKNKSLKQRILDDLRNGITNDVALEYEVCKTEGDVRKFLPSLKDLVSRNLVDWHPANLKTRFFLLFF